MKKRVTLILISLLFLTGCAPDFLFPAREEEPDSRFYDVVEDEAVVETVAEVADPVPFAVLYAGDDITRALYEPDMGAYLGVWLGPGMNKRDFETTVDKNHAVFAIDMTIGDEFPTTWILQAIAAQTTPLIILRMPEDAEDDFPLAELASLAYELGNYNLPMFVVFNPLTTTPAMSSEDYVLLFRYVRIIFRTYAPGLAFVWHTNDNTSTTESPFYPGHDVVDWVGLQALAAQGPEGFYADIIETLTPFYLSFQRYKPIMLLPMGIGHFSRRDYVYRVPEAAAEITRVYETIRDSFPRVRLIVYGNHGNTTAQGDDFSLTREERIIYAYQEATADSHFLSRLEQGGTDGPLWMRGAYSGYYYQGQIFVDRELLIAKYHQLPAQATEISGRAHININDVNGLIIEADHTRQVIYIKLP